MNRSFKGTMLFITMFTFCCPANSGHSWSSSFEYQDIGPSNPEFSSRQPTNLYATEGQKVLMPCAVHNLGDKTVAWIRTRDLNILTHGDLTFTADQRFEVYYNVESETWSLTINPVRLNDSGRYECQVNTDPKMSLFFNLKVEEVNSPKVVAEIAGPREQYVSAGSIVSFTCSISLEVERNRSRSRLADIDISWLHNGIAVSFQAERGGISVETNRNEGGSCSRLTVASVKSEDAGRYACQAGGASDTVVLIVIKDNESSYPANYLDDPEDIGAMQSDQETSRSPALHLSIVPLFLILTNNFFII